MKTIKNILETIRLWICFIFLGLAILVAPKDMKIHILAIMEIYKRMLVQVSAELKKMRPKERHLKVVDDEEK